MNDLKVTVWLRSKIETSDYAGNQLVHLNFKRALVRDDGRSAHLIESGSGFDLEIEVSKGSADGFETGKSYSLVISENEE
jgi:hypothetical protein